jgi:hypothetical protein
LELGARQDQTGHSFANHSIIHHPIINHYRIQIIMSNTGTTDINGLVFGESENEFVFRILKSEVIL